MKQLVNSHDSTTCYVELAVEARSRVITMHPYPIFLSKNSKSESNMTPAPPSPPLFLCAVVVYSGTT
jgi:hypothetical protein